MIKGNEDSQAQSWELEVICKNKKYCDAVIKTLLNHGWVDFEVTSLQPKGKDRDTGLWEGSYSILMWSHWFTNLASLTADLKDIEHELEEYGDE